MNTILFDVDGTILDSSYTFYKWWERIAKWLNMKLFENYKHFLSIRKQYHGNWKKFSKEEFWLWQNMYPQMFSIWSEWVIEDYKKYTTEGTMQIAHIHGRINLALNYLFGINYE